MGVVEASLEVNGRCGYGVWRDNQVFIGVEQRILHTKSGWEDGPKAESSSLCLLATRLLRLASERVLESPPWSFESPFSANHLTVAAPLNQNPMHDIIATNQTHTIYLGKEYA